MPIEPGSTEIVSGGVEEQAKQVLKNLKGVVEAGGSELGKIVKTNVSDLCHDITVSMHDLNVTVPLLDIPEVDGRFRHCE